MESFSLLVILSGLTFFHSTTNGQALVNSGMCTRDTERIIENLRSLELNDERMQEHIDQLKIDIEFTSKAIYSTADYHTYEENQTVVFSDVILNTGGGYNPNNGVFTCPRDGSYIVSVVLIIAHPGIFFDVMKNSQVIGRVFSQGAADVRDKSDAQWVSSSIVLFIQLQDGDRVYVRASSMAAILQESVFAMKLI